MTLQESYFTLIPHERIDQMGLTDDHRNTRSG